MPRPWHGPAGQTTCCNAPGLHADLNEAIADCRLVIGTSARRRTLDWETLEPPETARKLLAETAEGEVALLLGRESSGLTNAELARCQFLVHIPTNPDFSSLNLAAAAQVFAYEIRRCWREGLPEPPRTPSSAMSGETPRDLATARGARGPARSPGRYPARYRFRRPGQLQEAAAAAAPTLQSRAPRSRRDEHPARHSQRCARAQERGTADTSNRLTRRFRDLLLCSND